MAKHILKTESGIIVGSIEFNGSGVSVSGYGLTELSDTALRAVWQYMSPQVDAIIILAVHDELLRRGINAVITGLTPEEFDAFVQSVLDGKPWGYQA